MCQHTHCFTSLLKGVAHGQCIHQISVARLCMQHWPIKIGGSVSCVNPCQTNGVTVVCLFTRGVPIIGSAKISATNMVIFTNISIVTEQQEDRYCYRYLYSSKCIGFLRYSCGSLVPYSGLLFIQDNQGNLLYQLSHKPLE